MTKTELLSVIRDANSEDAMDELIEFGWTRWTRGFLVGLLLGALVAYFA